MVLQSLPSRRSILGEKYNIFLFQVHSLVQDLFNEDCPIARCKSRDSPPKGRGKKLRKKEKKESKNLLSGFFFVRPKMATAR